VRFFTEDWELILQKLHVDFLFFNLSFGHYFDGEFPLCCAMFAYKNFTESALADCLPEFISVLYISDEFELLKIVHVQRCLLLQPLARRRLPHEILANFTHTGRIWNIGWKRHSSLILFILLNFFDTAIFFDSIIEVYL